jgi:hypothetical protein
MRFLYEAARRGDPAALADFEPWFRSQHGSGLNDRQPWITFAARRRLEGIIRGADRAFEYGSGGSTLYLAKRVAELVTIEHDPAWLALVRYRLGTLQTHVTLELHEPVSGPDQGIYGSTDPSYAGMSFEAYASAIDRFPDEFFDLVLVDGRARPACVRRSWPKIRRGGWLILDNSERPEYASALATLAGWERYRHGGPGPYTPGFWETTFWRRPIDA